MAVSHSAQASAAGFVFQFDRALLHLARCGRGSLVGIETCDDVAVRDGANLELWEQDKHTLQPDRSPLTDGSKNLWNTLWIWLKKLRHLTGPTEHIHLSLVTNFPVGDCLARQISDARTDAEVSACVKQLRLKGTSKQEDVQALMNAVLAFDNDSLARVIRQCTLCDGGLGVLGRDPALRKELKDALRLPRDVCEDTVCEALAGWLKDVVMECWRGGREAWVSFDAFTERLFALVFKLRRERMRERPAHQILVTADQQEAALVRRFVEHLAIINAPEEEVTDSITNFIRFSTEYSRLLSEGEVDVSDWRAFFDELQDRWRPRFRHAVRNARDQSPEALGQNILFDTTCTDFRGTLAGQRTTYPYLTCGAYHRLADEDSVWWHPHFKPKGHRKKE